MDVVWYSLLTEQIYTAGKGIIIQARAGILENNDTHGTYRIVIRIQVNVDM